MPNATTCCEVNGNMSFARMDAGSAEPEEKPLLGLDSAMCRSRSSKRRSRITALLIGLFVVRPLITRMFARPERRREHDHDHGRRLPGGRRPVRAVRHGERAAGHRGRSCAGPAHAQGASARPDGLAGRSTPTAVPRSSNIDLSQLDGQFGEKSIKKVGEVVSAHPEEALSIIRTWLHQPV